MSDTSLILWAQQFATPALTAFFAAITFLGSLEFYMLAIPIVYWIFDKHLGFRFALFFVSSAYLNSATKHIFTTSRPPLELHLVTQGGYSFPSGHAQGSTVFWGFLALELKQRWAFWTAGILVFLISSSRIYLGVHWPIDILGGLAIGLALLALNKRFAPQDFANIPLRKWMVGSVLIAAILYFLHPAGDGAMTVGFLVGALVGYRLEIIYVRFPERATLAHNLVKLILGLGVLFLLRIALKPILTWLPGGLSTVVRYSCLGLWATLGAPYVFTKLGLFKND